jgi:hypothetical protein
MVDGWTAFPDGIEFAAFPPVEDEIAVVRQIFHFWESIE